MNRRLCKLIGVALLATAFSISFALAEEDEAEILRNQIEHMQQQLLEMQQKLNELQEAREREQLEREDIDTRIVRVEETIIEEEEADRIDVGGAVRLNVWWRDYDQQIKDRFSDFELELFRVNFAGAIGDVLLDAEWRRYNDFQAIHHAWVGYDFSDQLQMQLGITQVPFGILPYVSHSFWFTGNYYLGYEDDYDTGIKFIHAPSEDWTFHYGFFKNPEYSNDARADRYSFDLVTGGQQGNTETNQFNFRAERHLDLADELSMDVGLSLQAGQMYNRITERNGDRWALAGHLDSRFGPWNLRLQALRYEYSPENPEDVSDDFVQKGAFTFPFMIAAKANTYTYSISRSFDLDWGPITWANCYNEGTYVDPDVDNSSNSVQSVTGCSVAAGGVFAYFDWITGRNMWFAGGDGIGLDATTAGRWDSRFNINIGYYF